MEFITASGYLSARKIRSRFQTLVQQAVDRSPYHDIVRVLADPATAEVKLRIRDRNTVLLTPAFRVNNVWPRTAMQWPPSTHQKSLHNGHQICGLSGQSQFHSSNAGQSQGLWPSSHLISEIKQDGFSLLSKETVYMKEKQSAVEGDAWVMEFLEAEEKLLTGAHRKKCLSILKTLRDRHLNIRFQYPLKF